jgi:signal transduction histidine kinase
LAKRFAEEHGGSIELLSSTSSGAQFVVKLPGTQLPEASRVELDGIISLL